MSDNPYAPPNAEVTLAPAADPAVPDPILKKIRNAWIAGLISAGVTLAFTLLAISGTRLAGFSAWQFVDVVLILGLTWGIYKKSRFCATAMLFYFVVSKVLLIVETGKADGIALALVFLYYYAQGVHGTFAYHGHIKGSQNS